jgi:cell wall-associated NlpC family hydrolase
MFGGYVIAKLDITLRYALSLLNTPYKWGGDDPLAGYDCSGFVLELLKSSGLVPNALDLNAQQIHDKFPSKSPSPQLGDLAFYGKAGNIIHVGFCLNAAQMVEAGGGGSHTNTLADATRDNAYIRIRPINYRADFLCVTRPNWG